MRTIAGLLLSSFLSLVACAPAPEAPADETPARSPDADLEPGEGAVKSSSSKDGQLTLTVPAATVSLRRHGDVVLDVTVARKNADAEVTIETSTRAGVAPVSIVLAAGEKTGTLPLRATSDAALGEDALEIKATMGTSEVTADVALAVIPGMGDRDDAYGTGGVAAQPVPGAASGAAEMQSDGRIVFLLSFVNGTTFESKARRLDRKGMVESLFGNAEIPHACFDVAIAPDDRIVFGCTSSADAKERPVLGRLTRDGALDATFRGGMFSFDAHPSWPHQKLSGIAVQPDRQIVVGTEAHNAGSHVTPTVRFDAVGRPDPTFGAGGNVTIGDREYGAQPVALPGGMIALLANATVARTTPTGLVDATFGDKGVSAQPAPVYGAMATGKKGKLFVRSETSLARLTGTGARDVVFAPWSAPPNAHILAFHAFEDGSVWLGTETAIRHPDDTWTYTYDVYALDAAGKPLAAFGQDGHLTPPIPAHRIFETPEGQVLLASVPRGEEAIKTARLFR